MTNIKLTMNFPTSYGWSGYVSPKSNTPHQMPPHLFQVELEKDGWQYVDVFGCQGAQNIGLSNH